MATLKPLCTTCERAFTIRNDIFHDGGYWIIDDTSGIPHHIAAEELERSVEMGCFICKQLYRIIQKIRHDAQTRGESIDLPLFDEILCFQSVEGDGWFGRIFRILALDSYADLSFYCITKQVARKLGLRTSLDPSLRSPNDLKQAKAWLENFQLHHGQFNRRLPSTFVPNRLVHVRQLEKDSITSARLVTGTSLPSGTPYLSLSHCWGGSTFLTLTHANLRQFQTAIPVAELTAVFRDALYVAFQLGIPYIWIDSLCIIQDSPTDWEHTSKQMGEIYKRAVCNLSASAYKNGAQGLFTERGIYSSGVLPLQIDTQNGAFSTSAASLEDAQFYMLDESVFSKPWEKICNGPLFERAWVLQEQLLALRVLHFGRSEMF
ncbi:HET-domain-containing protein [Karstenula rhodostoma CBS 690.94]|uniref:HET-domain-containing protein n=1 Tax=Karstenula rhodostoma CBS 690.94 TaxID=1392251 RepID=A0A9P4PU74_9PLEO|nr:HET-domain-containing protein [Karstenula rhodostoma CBS 690.94]